MSELALLAVTRTDVASYIQALLWIYTGLIFVRILISWIPRIPYNRALYAVIQFVHDVTDPYLKIFRRIIPPIGSGGFGIDLSPLIGLLVLYILGGLLVRAVAG